MFGDMQQSCSCILTSLVSVLSPQTFFILFTSLFNIGSSWVTHEAELVKLVFTINQPQHMSEESSSDST